MRLATQTADRRDRVDQGQQLGDIVAVTAGEADLQGDAVRLDDQMVLGTGPTPFNRAGPEMVPPSRTRTWEPSTAHRSRSSAPAARNWARSSSCTAGQTPASVQARSRRQHVTPSNTQQVLGQMVPADAGLEHEHDPSPVRPGRRPVCAPGTGSGGVGVVAAAARLAPTASPVRDPPSCPPGSPGILSAPKGYGELILE